MKKIGKYLIVLSFLAVVAIGTSILYQPQISRANLSHAENTKHYTAALNKEATIEINNHQGNKTSEKFGVDLSTMEPKNAKVEITLKFEAADENTSERIATLNGSIFINNRAFGYQGKGKFEPFITPDTKETIYLGEVDGELKGVNMNPKEPNYQEFDGNNSPWFVTFNPETGQLHVAAGVGFENYAGHLFFGDNMMNKEYWDAFYQQVEERYKVAE